MQPLICALKLELMENEFMTGPENGLVHYPDNVTLIGQKCEHVRPLSAQTVFQPRLNHRGVAFGGNRTKFSYSEKTIGSRSQVIKKCL